MIILLGSQSVRPSLPTVLAEHGIPGPVVTVTAGWQENEDEDEDLLAAFKGKAKNLRLWARAEEVFRHDTALHAAYRARQERLRRMQDAYRIRLERAVDAVETLERRGAPAEEIELAVLALQALDDEHVRRCRDVHLAFEAELRPNERPLLSRHRREVRLYLERAGALAIAGGHVAVLLNRLTLFAVTHPTILAWAAGAMCVTDRVVLYHDHPPQGAGHAEVLEAGLGLCPGVVALPSPRQRLRMDDAPRISLYARRFAPSVCLALEDGAWAAFPGRRTGVLTLQADGRVVGS